MSLAYAIGALVVLFIILDVAPKLGAALVIAIALVYLIKHSQASAEG